MVSLKLGVPLVLLLAQAAVPARARPESFPVGEQTLREMLAASPSWRRPLRALDPASVEALRDVRPGWSLEVVFGHWCSDSAREIPAMVALLEALGPQAPAVRWTAVDRAKREPAAMVRRLGIERVPTFVVLRDGGEIGRVVERAEPALETAVLRILDPEPPAAATPTAR